MSSLVTNLNSSTAQKIVNWVTTADGTGAFTPPTRLNCRRVTRVGVGGVYWALWSKG